MEEGREEREGRGKAEGEGEGEEVEEEVWEWVGWVRRGESEEERRAVGAIASATTRL